MANICPAVGESTVALGWPRFTWLKELKSSARNWPWTRSENSHFLLSDASTLKKCGPKNPFLVALPKLPAAGRLQGPRVHPLAFSSGVAVAVLRQPGPLVPAGAVANQPAALGLDTLALPTRLARHGPVSASLPQLT